MRFEHRGSGAVLAGHARAGILFGALAGAVLFVVEVALPFKGRYVLLGEPLARVLFTYLVTFASGGLLAALAVVLLAGRTRFGRNPARYTPFYFLLALWAGVILWSTREIGFAMVRLMATSSVGLPYLGLLVGVVLAAILWGGALHRRKRALLAGRSGRVAFILLLLVLIGAFLAGRSTRSAPSASDRREGPNVVMIVLDALRADYVSSYGYERSTTPHMDSLADEGVVFDVAYSHGNRTIIAMPALFTSMYPSFHGAMGYKELISPLPPNRVTLAEMLNDAGYTTVALMTNIHLKSVFNMTQGFDRVDEFNGGCYDLTVFRLLRKAGLIETPMFAVTAHPVAGEVSDAGIEWLGHIKDRPFFLYLHYMDTHHPYTPPPEFARKFATTREGATASELFMETVNLLGDQAQEDLDEQGLQQLKDYYAASIAYADYEIGRVIDAVRALPDDRETIVVVTSDHGDEFLEHGTLYHNNIVIEELIRVPLIFWSSRGTGAGTRVAAPVRHIDVMPTLADMTGTVSPPEAEGVSLIPLINGDSDKHDVSIIAEGDFCTALIRDNWKLVYVDSTDSYGLYDLASEEGERRDLSSRNRDVLEAMKLELDEYMENAWSSRQRIHREADPETLEQLRKLGYL